MTVRSSNTARAGQETPGASRSAPGAIGGGLREDLKRFTRERILNAALASFQDVGFKETTVERIVELAGTTAPTFYRHFNGKDDLLSPLQDHLRDRVSACLALLTPQDIQSPAKLTRWLGDYMKMWREVHRLCKAFWDAASMEDSLQHETFQTMLDTAGTVERLYPGGNAAELATRKLRMGLAVLMLDRLAYLVNVAPDQATVDALVNSFADMMWHSVFGKID